MAETQRTYSELIDLFPDNTGGEISAQDVRDLVESLRTPHGTVLLDAPATIALSGVPVGDYLPIAGTFTLQPGHPGMSNPVNGQLSYDWASERHFMAIAALTVRLTNPNDTILARGYQDGGLVLGYQTKLSMGSTQDIGFMVLSGSIEMLQDSVIEVRVANESAANDITIETFSLTAFGFLA